jgi:hypothetical protein
MSTSNLSFYAKVLGCNPSLGGRNRAANMTRKQLSDHGRMAANARWKNSTAETFKERRRKQKGTFQ